MALIETLTDEDNPFVSTQSAGVGSSSIPRDRDIERNDGTTPAVQLTWCPFCKGYYDFDYHFGDTDVA